MLRTIQRLVVAAALAVPAIGSAATLIDDFDSGAASFSNGGLIETQTVQAGTMIGGGRFSGQLCYFGCYSAPYSTFAVGDGTVDVGVVDGGLQTTRILWGNTSLTSTVYPLGSLSLDVSGDTAFELKFSNVSAKLPVQLAVFSGSGYSEYRASGTTRGIVVGSGADQVVTLALSDFQGAATFSNINGIGLVLGGSNGAGVEEATANFSLDYIKTVGAVPEPGTWAMVLVGLGSMGVAARRRR